MDVAFFGADTIEEPAAGVPIPQNVPRSDDRCGTGRRREILHSGERAAEFVVLGECHDRAGSVRTPSTQKVRVYVRGLRGEAKSTEGPGAALHLEEAAARQGLPPADHGAAEGPVLVLPAAGSAHAAFLRNVIRMIPIKRTVRPTIVCRGAIGEPPDPPVFSSTYFAKETSARFRDSDVCADRLSRHLTRVSEICRSRYTRTANVPLIFYINIRCILSFR